jgi:hypothetical protein
MVRRQFPKQVQVSSDEGVFSDDADRVSKLRQSRQTPPGQLQLLLDGLAAVGRTAHCQLLEFSCSVTNRGQAGVPCPLARRGYSPENSFVDKSYLCKTGRAGGREQQCGHVIVLLPMTIGRRSPEDHVATIDGE